MNKKLFDLISKYLEPETVEILNSVNGICKYNAREEIEYNFQHLHAYEIFELNQIIRDKK